MLNPQFLLPIASELVIDLFAGGGGASTGIEQAIGRHVDIAVNHDPSAVSLHQANHPQTRHFVSDIFEVNPLHNIAHLLIGAALLIAGLTRVAAAKAVNITIGAVYLLLGIVGFFLVGTDANILALNTPDHFLHLVSAIVLLGTGLGADRGTRATTAAA